MPQLTRKEIDFFSRKILEYFDESLKAQKSRDTRKHVEIYFGRTKLSLILKLNHQ